MLLVTASCAPSYGEAEDATWASGHSYRYAHMVARVVVHVGPPAVAGTPLGVVHELSPRGTAVRATGGVPDCMRIHFVIRRGFWRGSSLVTHVESTRDAPSPTSWNGMGACCRRGAPDTATEGAAACAAWDWAQHHRVLASPHEEPLPEGLVPCSRHRPAVFRKD